MTTDDDSTEMNAVDLLNYMGTDAQKWTEQFLENTNLENAGPDFVGTVLSWFANAIEAGRTAGFSALYEEMKHSARNVGIEDTSEVYTPAQLIELAYKEIPGDHQCL